MFYRRNLATLASLLCFAPLLSACDSNETGTGGSGGSGGGGTGGVEQLGPGELCDTPSSNVMKLRFEPNAIALAQCDGAGCVARQAQVILDPDVCVPTKVTFKTSDGEVVSAPADGSFGLHKAAVDLVLTGGSKVGTSTVTATVTADDGTAITADLAIETLPAEPIVCSGNASASGLAQGETLTGKDGLAGASIHIPERANEPNKNSFLWSIPPLDVSLACGADMTPSGYVALGPAVTFGPTTLKLSRELPVSIPINPVLLPEKARWRHLEVVYTGPAFAAPRTVPVADPRVEKVGDQWAVTFKVPRFGTYQAVVRTDAGTQSFDRKLTHRAVIGVSMGGGGSAMFGMRHHNRFDVLAPLGGPVDWTWLLHHIENNHLAGFRPIAPGTTLADIQLTATPCTTSAACKADETCLGAVNGADGRCVLLPTPVNTYEHASTFNSWWYEYPKAGNGGSFSRRDYVQIFRDLALMFGNPNSDNLTPGAENLPAGVRPDDKSVVGDHPNGECAVTVDPLDGPDKEKQEQLANECPIERCANTLTLTNYFDDEYNPDGTFPVITVCDGSPQNKELTPWANTWIPDGNNYPLELGLAVDYNGNGVRDEMEPILRAGHEHWDDFGADGIPSTQEPGYMVGVNEDPAGDDYDPQYNPTGTENDHRYTPGEPFADDGIDGVPNTAQQPAGGWQQPGDGYDVGEGDGEFTATRGLKNFWNRDAHSIVRQWADNVPGGDLNDEALRRVDVWTDGGTRDLFNFAVDAQHLAGTFRARGRHVSYLTDFVTAPGLDPSKPLEFVPSRIVYQDLQGIIFQRYGHTEPTEADFENGSGQHVGSVPEIASRLQTALYFIGSRWPDPELRQYVEESNSDPDPDAPECEIGGNCEFVFESSFGRRGPVGITLPPGYANAKQKSRRYPVIYMLHGYGQTPEDLGAAIVFLRNWMNNPIDGAESRLPKAILVYVDGRCRVDQNGKAECIRGTFFTDSARADGAQDESWWLELMEYVEQNYRTMGEATVPWTE
ncbi:MAG: hypothetical protein IPK82_11305 [Polyangiaceae bacterium]|nr:hypothetical protein [Polyangiaceae bacterium]